MAKAFAAGRRNHQIRVATAFHCTGKAFTDVGPNGLTVTAQGGATVEATSGPYGDTLGIYDFETAGEGAYINDNAVLGLGTDIFEFHFHIKPSTWSASAILAAHDAGATDQFLLWQTVLGNVAFYSYKLTGNYIYFETSAAAGATGTWTEVIYQRYGTGANEFRIFVDGASAALTWYQGAASDEAIEDRAANMQFGWSSSGSQTDFDGLMGAIRLIKLDTSVNGIIPRRASRFA